MAQNDPKQGKTTQNVKTAKTTKSFFKPTSSRSSAVTAAVAAAAAATAVAERAVVPVDTSPLKGLMRNATTFCAELR